MGVDLRLGILSYPNVDDWWFCYDRLGLHRCYWLFSLIDEGFDRGDVIEGVSLKPQPLPEGVKVDWYFDEGSEETDVDCYGSRLTYLFTRDFQTPEFKKACEDLKARDYLHKWNEAILKFLWAMPPDAKIILYWH